MVRLVRNVGGIEGLHIALDAFTEDAERRLFTSQTIHLPEEQNGVVHAGQRMGPHHLPLPDDIDIFRICNVVRDCGLFPDYVTPDYLFAISCTLACQLACPSPPGGHALTRILSMQQIRQELPSRSTLTRATSGARRW